MRCSRDIHAYKQIYGQFKVTSNANTHALDCEEEQHIAAEGSSHFCLKDQWFVLIMLRFFHAPGSTYCICT